MHLPVNEVDEERTDFFMFPVGDGKMILLLEGKVTCAVSSALSFKRRAGFVEYTERHWAFS